MPDFEVQFAATFLLAPASSGGRPRGRSDLAKKGTHALTPEALAAVDAAAAYLRGPGREKTYFYSPIEEAYHGAGHAEKGAPTTADMDEVAAWMKEHVPKETRRFVLDAYFNPQSWSPPRIPQEYPQSKIVTCLEPLVLEAPPDELLRGIERRYADLLGGKKGESAPSPGVTQLNKLLGLLPPSDKVLEFEERLVKTEFSAEWRESHGRAFAVSSGGILGRLYEAGRFRPEMLAALIRMTPDLLGFALAGYSSPGGPGYLLPAPLRDSFGPAAASAAGEIFAENLVKMAPGTEEAVRQIQRFHGVAPGLAAIDLLHRRLGGEFTGPDTVDEETVGWAGEHILQRLELGELTAAQEDAAVLRLQNYPSQFLKSLLGPAPAFRRIICRSIDWMEVYPFITLLAELGEAEARRSMRSLKTGDPEDLLVDAGAIEAAIKRAGESRALEVLNLFSARGENPVMYMSVVNFGDPTVQRRVPLYADAVRGGDLAREMVEAVRGENAAQIEKGMAKRWQRHVRAFGLLPVHAGTDELVARYRRLRTFAAEAGQFRPDRRNNERAAATAALMMMAERAGYPSFAEFEVDMESRVAKTAKAAVSAWKVGSVSLRLSIDGIGARLEMEQGGGHLKAVPGALRKSPVFARAQDARDEAQAQVRRMRALFEGMMLSQEHLGRETLLKFRAIPAARACLLPLVLLTTDGSFGTLSPEGEGLVGIGKRPAKLSDPVRVAQPTDFNEGGLLERWQAEITSRGLAQPFKQVFRETYTPSARDGPAKDATSRFEGRALAAGKARALLAGRGWRLGWARNYDRVYVKRFRAQKQEAHWAFVGLGNYLGEDPSLPPVTGKITFERFGTGIGPERPDEPRLPIATVAPIVFSETMRDADLVVSVGCLAGRGPVSREVLARRGELVAALAHLLGLPGVRTQGEFAHVVGKLAEYRVQLGTGEVSVEPGHRVLSITANLAKSKAPFLPFPVEDEVDELVVARVFSFANDGAFKDKSLLGQIKGG